MSDALPDNALDSEPAAPAPGDGTAVGNGSVGGEDVVPAIRFNGLMSKYQSEKSEWDTTRAAFEAELVSLRNREEEPVVDDGLRDEVQLLRTELASERLNTARERAIEKYPNAAPLADLIVGNSKQEIEEAAQAIHQRLELLLKTEPVTTGEQDDTGGTGDTESVVTGSSEDEPEAPVIGSPAGTPDASVLSQEKATALASGDLTGFIRAQRELSVSNLA